MVLVPDNRGPGKKKAAGKLDRRERFPIRDESIPVEDYYRDRWQHDKIVRSTHGVNCSGSCSWQVFVRDGVITGERPASDYPDTPPDVPDQDPRGCARGLTSSWYDENPARVKYPYVRGVLLDLWRQARQMHADAVDAWASIARDPEQSAVYIGARGHGGLVRTTWDEVLELVAAAHVFTIREYGPDRVAGFSPSPAVSPVSHASGMRYLALTGGTQLSSYDWHADLPAAFPQTFGEQTDTPESTAWWDSTYFLLWGTDLPLTHTPDAHFMVEARYRGQKVVAVSPDYGEHVKFADDWLAVAPGMDGALAMAMGHVIFKEFYLDREVPYFTDYVKTYTDMPFLVLLAEHGGDYVPDRFLTSADLGDEGEGAGWKTVVFDEKKGRPVVPNGSQGFRWPDSGVGLWNLDLGSIRPALSLLEHGGEQVEVVLPRFDTVPSVAMHRSVPALRFGGRLVTTVFDLLLAQHGLKRGEARGEWPGGYEDADEPFTPAWQERLTGIPAEAVIRTAREFARNAELTRGRSMIATGAGVSHWVNADATYRAMITMLVACGCIGRDGGGLGHYVGQQKVRPLAGWEMLSTASDWVRPTRQMSGTTWFYVAGDQWRYEDRGADDLVSPLAEGRLRGKAPIDALAQATRLGWQPFHPLFRRNPLELGEEAALALREEGYLNQYLIEQIKSRALRFSLEDPDDPGNWPRILFVWRANLLGGSAQGRDYLVRHLLGSDGEALHASEAPPSSRPVGVTWNESAPVGKLDLLVDIDFRMTSTAAFADVVLPAATWYEKRDLSSTDLHGFVNCCDAAIDPQWEARSDWEAFKDLAREFSQLAGPHLGTRQDVVATALTKDSPAEASQPYGLVKDWFAGETDPVPGRTMPRFSIVKRDFSSIHAKYVSLGPLADTLGCGAKGLEWGIREEIEWLRAENGASAVGTDGGRPSLHDDRQAAETMLALSAATNGRLACQGFGALEERVGRELGDLAREGPDRRIRWSDVQARPQATFSSPEWPVVGSDTGEGVGGAGRRHSPFSLNVRHLVPWRTLTGRMQLALDHEWFKEVGEFLPTFRPPLDEAGETREPLDPGERVAVLRYLTPHSKWSINSTFQDNPLMLTLFRGGPVVWLSPEDSVALEVQDNDWVDITNRNGAFACRAVISPRVLPGVCYIYHASDRQIEVPRPDEAGPPSGTGNSLTRIVIKPTHLVGGYAQLSFAADYYGPTGAQRDERVVLRHRSGQRGVPQP
jgi:nitrate reductase / nitrite oxidoreductase, alpha subunit